MKFKFYVLCTMIALVGSLSLYGQTPTIDSLRRQLGLSHEVGQKTNVLLSISKSFLNINFDSSANYAKIAYELSESSNDPALKGKVHSMMGTISMMGQNLEQGIQYLEKGVAYAEEANDPETLGTLYTKLGKSYSDLGDMSKGIDYNLKALKICKEIKSLKGIANTEYILATIYLNNGNHDLDISYAQSAIAHYHELKDKKWQSILWRVIGDIYVIKNEYKQGQASFEKALQFAKDTLPESDVMTDVLTSYADLFVKLNKFDSTTILLNMAEGIAKKNNRASIKIDILLVKALMYEKQGRYDKLVATTEEVLKHHKAMIVGNKVIFLQMQSTGYSKLGNYKKAYENLLEAVNIRDTVLNQESLTKVRVLRDSFLLEAQEKEFDQKIEKETDLRNKILMIAIFLGLFLTLLILYIRSKFKTDKVISEKNQILEAQFKELLHLNYVKDQMFAMLSHDLRSPLRTALRLTDKLNNQGTDTKHNLRTLLGNTSILLDNLLFWAKSQIGGLKLIPTEVNLKQTIDEVLSTLNENIDQKMLRIANHVPNKTNVWFDQQILSTVIRNIMTNAIEHSPQEKTITIDNFEHTNETIVAITDEGKGIPHQIAEDIVKGKIRESDSSKFGIGGIGLTLSTQLLKAAEGRLEYDYNTNGGTIFKIIIPA